MSEREREREKERKKGTPFLGLALALKQAGANVSTELVTLQPFFGCMT